MLCQIALKFLLPEPDPGLNSPEEKHLNEMQLDEVEEHVMDDVDGEVEVEEVVKAMLEAVEIEGGVMAVDVELDEVEEVEVVEVELEEIEEVVEVEAGDGGGTGGAIGHIK